jgi:hypothetical protein
MSKFPQIIAFDFTIDHPKTGLLQAHFDEDVFEGFGKGPQKVFNRDQVTQYNLDDPGLDDRYSPVATAVIMQGIGSGQTAILSVVISSRKGIKIYYDPKMIAPHLAKKFFRDIVAHVERHGW